jgi:serine protease Do
MRESPNEAIEVLTELQNRRVMLFGIIQNRLLLLVMIFASQPILARSVSHGSIPDEAILAAEEARIAAIAEASQAAVAVFDMAGKGGGSGVVISSDGYALTNFHVVASCGAAMKCGLPDGKIYDAVIVGIDPAGDVALIQLLGRDDFPHAEWSDSDAVKVGDWAFTVGNPFLLAHDFQPSVAWGMISGIHRYQYPAGTLLEYTDCLQTDAAINPGNSGGPLFNQQGQLVGINGRGSFEKRGRVNVGVGYAISSNQIKRFLAHLKSGRIVDHATLGATVSSDDQGRVVIDDILERSDAFRRGLRYGDQLVTFAGRPITTPNSLKNVLGIYPRGWPIPLTYRRNGETYSTLVRLMELHDQAALYDMVGQEANKPIVPPQNKLPRGKLPPDKKPPPSQDNLPQKNLPRKETPTSSKLPPAVAERYLARRGYANYWYNLKHQQRIWDNYQLKTSPSASPWRITGTVQNGEPFELTVDSKRSEAIFPWGKSGALFKDDFTNQLSPPRSGGLLLALYSWQRFLEKGLSQYGEVYYLGQMPYESTGQFADCLVGIHAGIETYFYFEPESSELVGLHMVSDDDSDPCEIHFSHFDQIAQRHLPKTWVIRHGEYEFARLEILHWSQGIKIATPSMEPHGVEEN